MRRIQPLRSFEQFRDIVATYRLPRILLTALDLDLFTIIGTRSWTIPALARRLRASVRGVDILCRNLASAGVLVKTGKRYRNGKVAAAALNAHSPDYRGGYLELIRDQWNDHEKQCTEDFQRGLPTETVDQVDAQR